MAGYGWSRFDTTVKSLLELKRRDSRVRIHDHVATTCMSASAGCGHAAGNAMCKKCDNRTHAAQQADVLGSSRGAIFAQSLHCHDASMLPCAFFFLHFAFLFAPATGPGFAAGSGSRERKHRLAAASTFPTPGSTALRKSSAAHNPRPCKAGQRRRAQRVPRARVH